MNNCLSRGDAFSATLHVNQPVLAQHQTETQAETKKQTKGASLINRKTKKLETQTSKLGTETNTDS